jgi:ribose transport system permease protein
MLATAELAPPAGRRWLRRKTQRREIVNRALAPAAAIGMFIWVASLQGDVATYSGLTLLLSSAIPLVAASLAALVVISIGDIDVGIGFFIGLTNAISSQYLPRHELLGWLLLIGLILAYSGIGALIELGRVPAIVATLGASFIWMGAGLVVLPVPGGTSPGWLNSFFNLTPPLVPFPIVIMVVLVAATTWFMSRTSLGTGIRAVGANAQSARRHGWSILRLRMVAFGVAGLLGVIGGLSVTAVADSGSPGSSADLTLLAIAAVILGAGEFSGGYAFPLGAVAGAVAISLATSLLTFLNVSSNYQGSVVGIILIVILLARVVTKGSRR